MNETRTQRATKNILFGIISRCVNIIGPFIVRTAVIYKIGIEYAGLNSLFTSVLSVLSLTELGVGSAMTYSMYKPIAEHDNNKLNQILNLYRKTYHVIGIVICLAGLCLTPLIPQMVKGEIPKDINLYILYYIYLANTIASYFLFAYKQSLISAYMREDVNSKIRAAVYIILYVGQLIAVLLTRNYYVYTVILPLSTVLNNLLTEYFSRKLFPNIHCTGNLASNDKRQILKNVLALAGHRFGDVLTSSFDNIVISAVLGLTQLAIFSNYFYIHTAITSCFLVLDQALIPIIGNCIVTEDVKSNYKKMLKLQFIYVWAVVWSAICLFCLYQDAITIWVGSQYTVSMNVMISFVIYFLAWKINAIMALYKTAAGLWVQDKFRPYYSSILNLILNVFLVNKIGMSGVLWSTIIIFVFITIPIENRVTFKFYFKKPLTEYYKKMTQYIAAMLLVGLPTYWICGKVQGGTISAIILKLCICIFIPNIGYVILFFKTDEFAYVKTIICNILSRRKSENE